LAPVEPRLDVRRADPAQADAMSLTTSVSLLQLPGLHIREDIKTAIRTIILSDPQAQLFKRTDNSGTTLIISGITLPRPETQSDYAARVQPTQVTP
jgi:hypothetical protein